MRVAIDIDGCCANLLDGAIEMWGEPRVPYSYSLEEMFPMVPTIDIINWVSSPSTYRHLAPINQAAESLSLLKKDKIKITYVTSRPFNIRIETAIWLERNSFPNAEIIHTQDKANQVRGWDVAVEDSLSTALKMSKVCNTVVLMDWPYNQGACDSVVRVSDWEEIIGVIYAKYSSLRHGSAH